MKIKPEHLKVLSDKLKPLDTEELRAKYRAQGLTPRRYRWDLTYALPAMSQWLCDHIYCYADDGHIDTALRTVICDDNWEPKALA